MKQNKKTTKAKPSATTKDKAPTAAETAPTHPPDVLISTTVTANLLMAQVMVTGPATNRRTAVRLQFHQAGKPLNVDLEFTTLLALRELCDSVIRNHGSAVYLPKEEA